MNRWQGVWARAQITGLVVSSIVWLIVAGLSLPAGLAAVGVGILLVARRNTRAGLWWRFGVRPASVLERTRISAALVPLASLRGRRQPTLWVGRRLAGRDALMATGQDLILSRRCVGWIITGALTDNQLCALVAHSLGQQPVVASTLVAAIEAYCAPWGLVEQLTFAFKQVADRTPLLPLAWRVRWIVFGAAVVNSYLKSRWVALVGVLIIAVLSRTTSHFRGRWQRLLRNMGDERVIREGFGPTLAGMIRSTSRSLPDLERAQILTQGDSPMCRVLAGEAGDRFSGLS